MPTQRNTITWRLLGGIAVVSLLLAIYGVMAILGSQKYHDTSERLYRIHGTATIQLSTANDRLWHLRYELPQYFIVDNDSREKIVADEGLLAHQLMEILAEYSALPISAEEREQLEEVEASCRRYIDARPEWFALINAGNLPEANNYRERLLTPLGDEASKAFTALMRLQQEHARHEILTTISDASIHQKIAIGMAVLMLILFLPLALSVMRIMRTLKIAQKMAVEAATNVFNEPVVVAGRDELDTLVTTIQFTSERFVSHAMKLEAAQNELALQHENMEREISERTLELKSALVDTERQANEAARLAELNDRLQSCQNQDEASQVITAFAPGLFIDIPGRLCIINASRNLVDTFTQWGAPDAALKPLFEPDACWSLRRNRLHISDPESHDVCCEHVATEAALCVPLYTQDGALGVLSLDLARTGMSRHHIEQLSVRFANQVALALTNLRLREKLREQSILDSLTTLYNRRYFEETLGREIARSARHETPLSLIVIDVDHFKRFNDSYGHEAGDRVLNLVGRTIKASIRPSDIACRYGGEEFVVVMPDANIEAAITRANEFRRRISQESGELNQGQFGQITVSCGVAAYPEHGGDGTTLFIAGDKALYDAKHRGRNRVEVASLQHPEVEQQDSD